MSHQDRRAMMTPKRKCSFSSFSECRYVVDGGKTTTFLFAIETPSPSSHDNDQQTNCKKYHIFMGGFSSTILCTQTYAAVFYNVKNGSSFITSKSSSKNLSNENKQTNTLIVYIIYLMFFPNVPKT